MTAVPDPPGNLCDGGTAGLASRTATSRFGRRARLVVATLAITLLGGGMASHAAAAPGVPEAPTTVYEENFETGVGATPVLLSDYTGATGQTYTADPEWLTACNGVVLRFTSPDADQPASGCTFAGSYSRVRQIAYALGDDDPAANHAVSAYTEGVGPGLDRVQFETESPIVLPRSGRFITFSVDAAETSCDANNAQFKFYLLDGASEIPTFSSPIMPCTDPGSRPVNVPAVGTIAAGNVLAGSYAGNRAVLFNGSSLGIRMRNGQTASQGNDAGFDNIRVLDATPQLDKSFGPTDLNVGATSTLTFTITNTSELGEKQGWSFTDNLPAGLVVANPSGAATTCANGTVDAPAGGGSIAVTGDLEADQVSCTVTVGVTASNPGSYTNGPDNVTGEGIDPPTPSTVTFRSADLSIVKSASQTVAVPGKDITYQLVVKNNGPDAAVNMRVSDALPDGLTFVSASPECALSGSTVGCGVASLPSGATQTFTVTAKVASSVDERVENTATVGSETHDPTPGNNTSTVTVPIEGEADLSIVKRASVGTVGPGGQILYTLTVKNAGPSDATGVTVSDIAPLGLALVSAKTSQGFCSTIADKVICTMGTVVAGGSAQVQVTATATGAAIGGLVNRATVIGDQEDPTPGNNTSTTTVNVPPATPVPPAPQPVADLSITKRATSNRGNVGERLTYRIVVRNNGPVDATGVRVTDTFSAPVGVVSVRTTAGSCQRSSPFTCSLGTIKAGRSVTITVVATPRVAGTLRNAASVTGEGLDPKTDDNMAVVKTPVKGVLRLTKTVNRTTVKAGQTVTYTLRVTNATGKTLRNVKTCDLLPSGMVAVRSAPKAKLSGGRHCWTIKRLASGKSKTYRLTVRALVGTSGTKVNRATATASGTKSARATRTVRVSAAPVKAGGVTG